MCRFSLLYCSIIVTFNLLQLHLIRAFRSSRSRLPYVMAVCSWTFSWMIYIGLGTYMMVQVLISLRTLPRTAYDSVQWSTFLPHV